MSYIAFSFENYLGSEILDTIFIFVFVDMKIVSIILMLGGLQIKPL
jgi:hypothetical protein